LWRFQGLLASTLLACAGCNASPSPPTESAPTQSPPAVTAAEKDKPASAQVPSAAENQTRQQTGPDITLQVLDYEGIVRLVESHKGKIVVVDAWATYCPPCVREFPNLVALSRKYELQDVVFISLSFDYQGDAVGPLVKVRPVVEDFLKRHAATFENVLASVESDALLKLLAIPSLPAVMIYDREGNLVKRFDSSSAMEFTYEDVDKFVQGILSRSSPK
jgi:thiol-disulfide isomerase/thioredoxin